MDNPVRSPPLKKIKIIKSQSMFKHINDKEKCMQITKAIHAALLLNTDDFEIPQIIIQEISQFATGFLIQCSDKCSGYIHFLYGNNFQENIYQLYNYECDNPDCHKINHIFHCSWGDCKSICIKRFDSDLCKYVSQCTNGYCSIHKHTAMYQCYICDKYSCNDCIEKLSKYNNFWVNTTIIDHDEKLVHCYDCYDAKQSPLTEDTTD